MAARSANYTNKILEGVLLPRKNFKEFQDMMGLIECALRREAMVNHQPISWASEDVLRRVSQALMLHTEALPTSALRLRHKLTEAAGKIDTYQQAGKVTFHDIKNVYVAAYRSTLEGTADRRAGDLRDRGEAEVVLAALEQPRDDRYDRNRGRGPNNRQGGQKGPWRRQHPGRRYNSGSPEGDKRKRDESSSGPGDAGPEQATMQQLHAEIRKLKAQLADQSGSGAKRPGAFMAQEGSESEAEDHDRALAAVQAKERKEPRVAKDVWTRVDHDRALAAFQAKARKAPRDAKDVWTKVPVGRAFVAMEVTHTTPRRDPFQKELKEYDFSQEPKSATAGRGATSEPPQAAGDNLEPGENNTAPIIKSPGYMSAITTDMVRPLRSQERSTADLEKFLAETGGRKSPCLVEFEKSPRGNVSPLSPGSKGLPREHIRCPGAPPGRYSRNRRIPGLDHPGRGIRTPDG